MTGAGVPPGGYPGDIRIPGHASPGQASPGQASRGQASPGAWCPATPRSSCRPPAWRSGPSPTATCPWSRSTPARSSWFAGEGADAERYLLERFGAATGPLVALLRERRLRQRLADGFVQVPDRPALDLVEYAAPAADGSTETGVAQLAFDPWGATLAPVDERRPVRRVRRADITEVLELPQVGGVRVTAGANSFEILRVGAASARVREQFAALPRAAQHDMGAIIASLVPDLAPGTARGQPNCSSMAARRRRSRWARPGNTWRLPSSASPTFAASYAGLRQRREARARSAGSRWRRRRPRSRRLQGLVHRRPARQPDRPGAGHRGRPRTYCFKVIRGSYPAHRRGVGCGGGGRHLPPRWSMPASCASRSPAGMPSCARRRGFATGSPAGAASLALARSNFVARLVHSSEEAWGPASTTWSLAWRLSR